MSHASKKIDWCLKKAEKELAERKGEGKSPKHRGLVKAKPSREEAKNHLDKAEHNLKATKYLIRGDFTDTSIETVFYSMYQCFLSIATRFGYDSGNQTCTISLMQHLKEEGKISLDDKFLKYFMYDDGEINESVIETREEFTYGTKFKVEKRLLDFFVKECKELIDVTREIVLK